MDEDTLLFVWGFVIGVAIFGLILAATDTIGIRLDKSAGKEICQKLNNNTIEYSAYSEQMRLVCEEPSYDNT